MNKVFYSFATLSVATSLCFASNLDKTDALIYLNSLRSSAGLSSLSHNQILETAAQNHINYLQDTGLTGHYENNSQYPSDFYTGDKPHDRGVYAGYKGSYYLENFSSGQKDFKTSIDGLMSAIYHRYGFLDLNVDEIGMGVNDNKLYNYNMANSLIDELCYGENYDGNEKYYFNVCSEDDFKIEATLYDNKLNTLIEQSPDIVIWPPLNAIDIPPVFYEESPDPLPNQSVSGYPISIEFNSYRYKDKTIVIDSFKLFNEEEELAKNTLLMDESNDINEKHSKYQFTLFPLDRLEWNHIYRVAVGYSVDGQSYTKGWSFRTQNIPYPLYIIDNEEQNFTLKSDTTYAFYFKPTDEDDTFNATSFSYNTDSKPEVTLYDSNTLLVTLSGEDDRYCNVELKKGDTVTKKLSLTLGENSMKPIADKELDSSDIIVTQDSHSYTTENGTTFKTNIDNSVYENLTLTTSKIDTADNKTVFVTLSEDTIGDVLVSLNIDNVEFNLPKFAPQSQFNIEELNNRVILTINTKLKKPMFFEGLEDVQ